MPPLPPLNEGTLDLLLSYSVGSGEEMAEGVVNAFLAANIDVFERQTQLVDWVDPDILEAIQQSADHPIYLCTQIWDHQVVMTSEEVRIYSPSALV